MRSGYRDAEALARRDVRGRVAAADIRGPARRDTAVRPLRATQTELEQPVLAGRDATTGRLGGHERLEVHDVEQRGFDKLTDRQRAGHADERLSREDDRALTHRIDVAREPQPGKHREEVDCEQRTPVSTDLLGEKRYVGVGESPAREPLERLLDAGSNGETAVERVLAIRQVEAALGLGPARGEVRLSHRQLVEIGEHR